MAEYDDAAVDDEEEYDEYDNGGTLADSDNFLKNPLHWRVGYGEDALKTNDFYERPDVKDGLGMLSAPLRKGILQAHCEKNSFLQHNLDSYNYLVHVLLPHIVHESSAFETEHNGVRHVLKVVKMYMDRPAVMDRDGMARETRPQECRLRGDTYGSQMYMDVDHLMYAVDESDADAGAGAGADAESQTAVPKEKRAPRLLQKIEYREIFLPNMIVAIGSDLCNLKRHNATLEEGLESTDGTFVINGADKVIIAQTDMRANKPFIFATKGQMFSPFRLEMRSCHEDRLRSTSTMYMNVITVKGAGSLEITVTVPFVEFAIPVVALFRIFGVTEHADMIACIVDDDTDSELIAKASSILDCDIFKEAQVEEIFNYIARLGTKEDTPEKRVKYMEHICTFEVLPQLGMTSDDVTKRKKALYLGHMVCLLLKACMGHRGVVEDNRDDYRNKRLLCSGHLIAKLLRQHYRDVLKKLHIKLKQLCHMHTADPLAISMKDHFKLMKPMMVGMRYSFATGAFGKNKGGAAMQGVVQSVKNMNRLDSISHGRRNNSQANRDSKAPSARALTTSHWGVQCAVESPEGTPCGLVRNQALLCHIRLPSPSDPLENLCLDLGTKPLLECSREERSEGHLVQVNGRAVGCTRDPDGLIYTLRTMRRAMNIPFSVSIAYVPPRQVLITSDAGALLWPVFVLENIGKLPAIIKRCKALEALPSVLWDELLYNGVIEYIDKEEALNCRVAMSPQDVAAARGEEFPYTHLEIHPICIFGVCGAIIPFAEFNQSPRDMYASAMMKQAVPAPAIHQADRTDNLTHTLCYPQRPLVQTCMEPFVNRYQPFGENVMVAFITDGYGVEDPIIFNKGSVDRGRFRSMYRRTIKVDNRDGSNTEMTTFKKPNADTLGRRRVNYDTLDDETGIALPGTQVQLNDALVGKIITSSETRLQSATAASAKRKQDITSQLHAANEPQGGKKKYRTERDASVINKFFPGTVSSVMKIEREANTVVKTTLQSMRTPEEGDKFSSRHGQKGTISHCRPEVDMPWDPRTGMRPDIIVNPHAIPSRMTIGQKLEMSTALYAAIKGGIMDVTPFDTSDEAEVNAFIERLFSEIKKKGYNRFGETRLCNGMTGEMMEASILMAPCYYLRLRHIVSDKIHTRRTGPVQIITRQPVEGRGREGGLRNGAMEHDNLKSHGAAYVAKDRMANNADPWELTVCGTCGLPCDPARPTNYLVSKELARPYCRGCKSHDNIRTVPAVYAYKLVSQEMEALNMVMRNRFDSLDREDKANAQMPAVFGSLDDYLAQLEREDPEGTVTSLHKFINFDGPHDGSHSSAIPQAPRVSQNPQNPQNPQDIHREEGEASVDPHDSTDLVADLEADIEFERMLARAETTREEDLMPPAAPQQTGMNLDRFAHIFRPSNSTK